MTQTMVLINYPRLLTDGQINMIMNSGKTKYAIAKEGKMNQDNFNKALKKEREVNVATVIKVAKVLGIPFEEFEIM